jgi:heme exporter protein B
MLRAALVIAAKDLRLMLLRGTSLVQALLLGLLLIFLFSLAADGSALVTPTGAATIFWLASAFCQTLIFSALYALEEGNGQRLGLLLAPVPVQSVWLGKAAACAVLLILVQALLLIAAAVFLGQAPRHFPGGFAASLLLTNIGIAASGSLIGALAQGQSARDSLASILLFPLLTPLFLAGIRAGTASFAGDVPCDASWLGLTAAFDAIFLAAGIVLFPFVYGDDG